MRTLTTLTAVAALVAGMSLAAAQNAPSNPPQNSSPSAINKSNLPSPNSGSESQATAKSDKATGNQQTQGNGKFCIEQSAGGSWDCKYASLAACEKDGKADNRLCHPNPKSSTTGAK